MIDALPLLLTGAIAFLAAPWATSEPEPTMARIFAGTLGPLLAPIVFAQFFGPARAGRRRIRDRILAMYPYFAPLAAGAALALGRLPGFLSSRAPDLPAFANVAAAEAVALLAVLATLAGERAALHRDGRYEPPSAGPRLRLASLPLGAPVILTSILDALRAIPGFRIYYDSHAVAQILVFVILGFAVFLLLPWIVRIAIPSVSLPPGPLRSSFEAIARGMGVPVRDFFVAKTDYHISNAALVGGIGPRTILLTDRLIAEHPPDELAAVVGHELGHARAGHIAFLAILIAAAGVWFLCIPESLLTSLGPWVSFAAAAAILVIFFRCIVGPLARQSEHEADWVGAQIVGSGLPIQRSLERIVAPDGRAKGSWRHPSVDSRVRFLALAFGDARHARRPTSILHAARAAAALALLGGIVVFAIQQYGRLPQERVAASIRAGRYDAAVAIARENPSPAMEPWDQLARAAAGTGVAGPDTVRDRARAAFARGDFEKAFLLARVVALRVGRPSDELLASVAEEAAAGRFSSAAEAFEGPASFLARDPYFSASVARIRKEASAPASAPGNTSRPMGS